MSDIGPDPGLAQQKARLDIATQQQKIAQYQFDLVQQKVQRERTMTNIRASQQALEEAIERLNGLIEAHGEVRPPSLDVLLG
jgi:hypothetical protein